MAKPSSAPQNRPAAQAAAHAPQHSAPHAPVQAWWKHPRAVQTGWATLAAALLGVAVWFFYFHPYVSTDDARVDATLVRLAPQGQGGQVIKVAVSEGDPVTKGEVLVELDHGTAQAQLERATAQADLAERELKRISQLAAQRGVSERQLDQARSAAQTADAEEKLAQIALDDTYLKSPMDGVVVQKSVDVGDMIETGQTAVTVADMADAWVAANLEETEVGDVRLGQKVDISIDEGGSLTGEVEEIRQATLSRFSLIPTENTSGNFIKLVQRIPIKVKLDPHPGTTLRVGQSVEVRIRVH